MLSRDEVRELAARHQLLDHAEFLMDLPRAGWRLDPDPRTPASAPRASKIGGGADMAEGELWPLNGAGVPYALLAQIDCAHLPALDDEWPASAIWQHRDMLLRVFADCAHVDGTDVIVLEAAPETKVHRRERPPLPAPWPFELPPQNFGLGENAEVREAAIRARPFVSVVVPGHEASGITALPEYHRWAAALTNGGQPGEQSISTLVSEPIAVQHNPLGATDDEGNHPSGWRVLLHLATDERLGFDYGGGACTVIVPTADMAAGRYDRAACVWQF